MARLAAGAAAVYNCANPAYHRWPALWPPIAAALLAAAEGSGAMLVTIANLYGYGPARDSLGREGYDADHPMTEDTPLAATGSKGKVRADMWRDALAAHQAGRVRATEVRASDYVGPDARERARRAGGAQAAARQGGPRFSAGPDRPHTWTYTGDVAALAVLAGREPSAWGRAWHTPSGPPLTQRQAVAGLASAAGVPMVPVRSVPAAALWAACLPSPLMRELRETEYQFSQDFVMDSSAARQAFGIQPPPWDQVLTEVLRSYSWPAGQPAAGGLSSLPLLETHVVRVR